MNLNNRPTIDQLATLFAARKDTLDSHILWVCESGEVKIEPLTPHAAESEFEQSRPTMKARLRTYRRGAGYVGRKAAADREFLGRVLHTLKHEWQQVEGQPSLKVVDQYC